jgi:hypothetical protein
MFFPSKILCANNPAMEQQLSFTRAHGKTIFAASLIAVMGFFASPASAACTGTATITCTDSTTIKAYQASSFMNTYTANNFSAGIGDVLQSSGHNFNTDKLIATLTEHRGTVTLELKYYTSFDGSELGAHYADIFLGSASDPNNFGYAIALGDQSSNGGLGTSGFYKVTSSTEKTSRDIWSGKSGEYGGKHLGMKSDGTMMDASKTASWFDSPTVLASNATKKTGFTTSVVEKTTTDDGAAFGHLVDVKLTASATDFNTLFGAGLSIFWGTADCSNDAIQAVFAYKPTSIPEPMTLGLFSVGAIGAGVLRRRRRRK